MQHDWYLVPDFDEYLFPVYEEAIKIEPTLYISEYVLNGKVFGKLSLRRHCEEPRDLSYFWKEFNKIKKKMDL